MRADPTISRSLLPIAEGLMAQMRAVGPLTQRGTKPEELLENESINTRLRFTVGYLMVLENLADLRLHPGEAPLLYNTSSWPATARPAGWVEDADELRPSALLQSYSTSWSGHTTANRTAARRFLKAALWVSATNDAVTAVRYLLDLTRHGFVMGWEPLATAMAVLLEIYRAVDSDAGMYPLAFGPATPVTREALIHGEFATDFRRLVKRRDVSEEIVETLIDAAQAQIERARSATNYDDWFLAQAGLGTIGHIVQQTVESFVPTNVTLEAILEQIEEIYCDAGAVFMGHADAGRPFRESMRPGFNVLRIILSAQIGVDAARQRIVHERALVPWVLEDTLFGDQPLPPEWRGLSPRLAGIIGPEIGKIDPALVRARPFTAAELEAIGVIEGVGAKHGLDEVARRAVIAEVARETEKLDEAASSWRYANGDLLRELAGELRGTAAVREITTVLKRSLELDGEGRYAEAVTLVDPLAELYPWTAIVHYELAVALDKSGNAARALHHVEQAVLLEPQNGLHWQSLFVILKHCGAGDEAGLAAYIAHLIAEGALPLPVAQ